MGEMDWTGRKLHFIAIGGAGMSGLALVCHRLGARVTGSDRAESELPGPPCARPGSIPWSGTMPTPCPPDAEVVVSTAIGDDNPELVRARERGQAVLHRGALLAELCAEGRLIAVAGTHGKTTTTGMIVHALRELGADPALLHRRRAARRGPRTGRAGERRARVRVTGWSPRPTSPMPASSSFAPEVAVVTNVELDHHARWCSRAELTEAFARFADGARASSVSGAGPRRRSPAGA